MSGNGQELCRSKGTGAVMVPLWVISGPRAAPCRERMWVHQMCSRRSLQLHPSPRSFNPPVRLEPLARGPRQQMGRIRLSPRRR